MGLLRLLICAGAGALTVAAGEVLNYSFDREDAPSLSPAYVAEHLNAGDMRGQEATIQTTGEFPDFGVVVYDFTSGRNGFAFDVVVDEGYQLLLTGYSLVISGNPSLVGGPDGWLLTYVDRGEAHYLAEGQATQSFIENTGSLASQRLGGEVTFLLTGTGALPVELGALGISDLTLRGEVTAIPEPANLLLLTLGGALLVGSGGLRRRTKGRP
ncbi:MAG: PEP-CTERM sorting domain-containing protein [Verrucomicrobiales bacterium]|nr:PEP-CTERM sorting domain-containing protein [Verrucomicrobiales bacterium]